MWFIYNVEDNWMCGWTVETREEAEEICKYNDELDYKYVDLGTMERR